MMAEFRKGFKQELRSYLKTTCPKGYRIDVQFEDQ